MIVLNEEFRLMLAERKMHNIRFEKYIMIGATFLISRFRKYFRGKPYSKLEIITAIGMALEEWNK